MSGEGPRLTPEEEEALERAIAPLREAFRKGLGARFAAIEAHLSAARAGGAADLETAHHLSHALRGTAGSYGFDAVSAVAAAIEDAIAPHLAALPASAGLPWNEIDAALARLRATVREASRAGS